MGAAFQRDQIRCEGMDAIGGVVARLDLVRPEPRRLDQHPHVVGANVRQVALDQLRIEGLVHVTVVDDVLAGTVECVGGALHDVGRRGRLAEAEHQVGEPALLVEADASTPSAAILRTYWKYSDMASSRLA